MKKAISHFIEFHKGPVNIVLHVCGFAGIFYSLLRSDWLLFAGSLIIVELGHVYNHFTGLRKYDMRPNVILWRILIFLCIIISFYAVTHI